MLRKFSSCYGGEGATAGHLQPDIIRLSGDVPRASLLRCSRNKLSGTGELLNQHLGRLSSGEQLLFQLVQLGIRVLVLLVFEGGAMAFQTSVQDSGLRKRCTSVRVSTLGHVDRPKLH